MYQRNAGCGSKWWKQLHHTNSGPEEEVLPNLKRTDPNKVKADRLSKKRKSVLLEQCLVACCLHIHGWGLFTMVDLPKDTMIVEYMGETVLSALQTRVRKVTRCLGLVAATIVDATMIGCMACFMNHCC